MLCLVFLELAILKYRAYRWNKILVKRVIGNLIIFSKLCASLSKWKLYNTAHLSEKKFELIFQASLSKWTFLSYKEFENFLTCPIIAN